MLLINYKITLILLNNLTVGNPLTYAATVGNPHTYAATVGNPHTYAATVGNLHTYAATVGNPHTYAATVIEWLARRTCTVMKRSEFRSLPMVKLFPSLTYLLLLRLLSPVILEVPHFASLRGKEREIVILRSDNGETWREHTLEATEEAVQEVLNESFDGEGGYWSFVN